MQTPTAAIIVIGDEILSGRTQDTNSNYLAQKLTELGIELREVRIVRDDHDHIVGSVRTLSKRYDHVFTSGGIGPTHDDITAEAVSAAFHTSADVREDARALLEDYYTRAGKPINEARLRMARIPQGATLIDNPISAAPGFKLENVCVLAGVPSIFRAMVASVLPTLTGGTPLVSKVISANRPEGDLAQPLADVAAQYPNLSFGSYPFYERGIFGTNIVVRGHNRDDLGAAIAAISELLEME